MKALFGTTWLAPGGVESVGQFSINGQQINDEAQFYRAAAVVLFARGNRSMQVSLSVWRKFDTNRQAERFALQHFSDLSQQDTLFLYLGTDADSEIATFPGAVIDSMPVSYSGTSVKIQYNFRCGLPSFDVSPPDLLEPDDTMIKRSSDAITPGATTMAVVFSVPFSGKPVVSKPGVSVPDGSDFVEAWVVANSVSSTGFNVKFNTAIPGSDYTLDWIACG